MADLDATLSNCTPLLAPGGTFVATTNSRDTMAPYFAGVRSALAERLPQVNIEPAPNLRFSLENGAEFLLRHFDRIELRVWRDAFRFPNPEPWAAYLKSGRQLMLAQGHSEEEWAEVSAMIDRIAEEQCAGGELIVPKLAGMFLSAAVSGEARRER